MDNAQKLAILPMWVIDRIKEEMRLSPAAWQVIIAAVEQAEVPQTLPCEVKLPPGTVLGKGVPVSTLMLAIAQRERYPVHAQAFAEQHQGDPVGPKECEACGGWGHVESADSATCCGFCDGSGIEPNGPFEHDELTDFATWKRRAMEAESKLRTYDPQVVELGERAMQALLTEPKPNELMLTKCRLCDQLQADLTERDEEIDRLKQALLSSPCIGAGAQVLAFMESRGES